jgi:hypothetical protein
MFERHNDIEFIEEQQHPMGKAGWVKKYWKPERRSIFFGILNGETTEQEARLTRKTFPNARLANEYAVGVLDRYEQLKIARDVLAAKPKRGRPPKKKEINVDTSKSDSTDE